MHRLSQMLNLQNRACSCPAVEHKPLATSCSTGVRAVQTKLSAPAPPTQLVWPMPCWMAPLLSLFSQEGADKPQHPGMGKKGTGTWQGYPSWQPPCQPSAPGQAAILMTNREAPPAAAPAPPPTTFQVTGSIWGTWCFPFLLPLLAPCPCYFPSPWSLSWASCLPCSQTSRRWDAVKSSSLGSWPCTLGGVAVPWCITGFWEGQSPTHRGAACGSADKTCPGSCLPEAALPTISSGHVGKRSEQHKWGRLVNLKWTLTRALVLLCLCCGFWHQLTWACMGETSMNKRAGLCCLKVAGALLGFRGSSSPGTREQGRWGSGWTGWKEEPTGSGPMPIGGWGCTRDCSSAGN